MPIILSSHVLVKYKKHDEKPWYFGVKSHHILYYKLTNFLIWYLYIHRIQAVVLISDTDAGTFTSVLGRQYHILEEQVCYQGYSQGYLSGLIKGLFKGWSVILMLARSHPCWVDNITSLKNRSIYIRATLRVIITRGREGGGGGYLTVLYYKSYSRGNRSTTIKAIRAIRAIFLYIYIYYIHLFSIFKIQNSKF